MHPPVDAPQRDEGQTEGVDDAGSPKGNGPDREPPEVLGTQVLPRPPSDPEHLHASTCVDVVEVGIDPDPLDRDGAGRFVKGNGLWRAGQAARIEKAVAVRAMRLARTKAIMETLEQVDCEAAVRRLVELVDDDDPKISLAAIKMILDTVVTRDGGEVDPDARGGGPTFQFVIPVVLPVAAKPT